ncbi:hypothetical protein C5D04_10090 [Rathayibacter sp. AY1D2]|jgi:hypothetical protein|uniref:hypothetical protein n=1 Tax=unclassified Rathayibacter TaxID=2609250 RepID=UPI000CE88527|nr:MULTISPECIES: hypothetical protein [unclassified Rathayibacter]PPG79281.1 hypothetical protein C5C52_12635 [Rathayibacter sp. AY1E5]PPH18449.1 hypothetical protein C5C99_13670 [Rathayibacter sp. AY1C4]PPH27140.1 hypothetical protein C5C37_14425 [Rathayibacter sp. AY1F9]PPH43730.1 hypothetical protein C5D09_14560 [Rathayibacter sp. AY1C9]PPH65122.1 hypothetical protein C5D25_04690 [Rathayibacter sp. AY1D7]
MNDSEPRNPFTTKGFIIGATVVGVLALSGIVLGVTSLDAGGGGTTTADPGVSTPNPSSTLSAEAESVCGLPGYEETGTLTAAPTTEWTIVGTMAAPESAVVGPGITGTDGVRSCYAHTPEGALFAIANVWAMGTDARLSSLVTAQLTVPGAGRDAALAKDTTQSNTGLSAQIAGFKLLSYSGTDATVDTAFQVSNGSLLSFAYALKWVEGDWKIVLTDEGDPTFRPVALQSLGGYVTWSGVS